MKKLSNRERSILKNDIVDYYKEQNIEGNLDANRVYTLYYEMKNLKDEKLIKRWKNNLGPAIRERGYDMDEILEKRLRKNKPKIKFISK